jgi:hypothetical protein
VLRIPTQDDESWSPGKEEKEEELDAMLDLPQDTAEARYIEQVQRCMRLNEEDYEEEEQSSDESSEE